MNTDNINGDYLKIIKGNCDKGNNFIDYFLTIGVHPDIFLNKWLYQASIDELNIKYKSELTPKLITKFPPIEKELIDIDESIINYCFPNGFNVSSFTNNPKPTLFSFMLDNNYYSKAYPRKYLSCILFYESISKYKRLYDNYHGKRKETEDPPNQLNAVRSQSTYGDKIPFISPSFDIELNEIQEKYDDYYIPKCLVIASLYPFFKEFERILKDIHQCSLRQHYPPLYKLIENIVFEIPVPPRGLLTIEYTNSQGHEKTINQNQMNEIPLIHVNLKIIFDMFSPDYIIDLIQTIIIETRVIVFSSDITLLNPFMYGLVNLLFPFEYLYPIITILPKDNYNILENTSPCIIGINQSYTKTFFNDNDLLITDSEITIVDIDNKDFFFSDNYTGSFPKNIRTKLEKNLKTYLNDINEKKAKTKTYYKKDNNLFNREVSMFFFDFYSSLLENYSVYLNSDFYTSNGHATISSLFKVKDFIATVSNCDKLFYSKFLETQIFINFLYKRLIPQNSQEKLSILLFDEKIEQNKSALFYKPKPVIFTLAQNYSFSNNYRVFKPRGLSVLELQYYQNAENKSKIIKKGMLALQTKAKSQIVFKTPVFPALFTNEFLNETYHDHCILPNLIGDIESINNEIISKTHLSTVAVHQTDMENYIDLCWIQLWAMTLWYHDPIEKRYRFNQLQPVLMKLNHQDMEIINLLFDTISKYGEDYMLISLYNFIIKSGLNPSSKVHVIMMKLLDRKQLSSLYKGKHANNFDLKYERETISHFRKRTFKSKYKSYLLNGKVTFYAFDTCMNCRNNLNLKELSLKYKEMKRNLFWASCPNCKIELVPKLSVILGNEINQMGYAKNNTSLFDSVVLNSPLNLKSSYQICLLKDFGTKLDLDEFSNKKYNAIFWGSIWYFAIKGLPYDICLPYEDSQDINMLLQVNEHIIIGTADTNEFNEHNSSFCNIEEKDINDTMNQNKIRKSFHTNNMTIEHNNITITNNHET